MHSTYMAYIFNDRNSTFWHALVLGLRAYTVPSSTLTALLSEKRQSTGRDMQGSAKGIGSWFLLQSDKACPCWGGTWSCWALVGSLKQQMTSTQVSIALGTEESATAPQVPFRVDHGWLERLFVQWGNDHRVQKGEQGVQRLEPPECLQPEREPRIFLAGSSRGKWGWLQLCKTPRQIRRGHVQLEGRRDENGVSLRAQFGLEGSFWGFLQR